MKGLRGRMSNAYLLVVALIGVMAAGCATTPVGSSKLDALVSQNVALAKAHLQRGEDVEMQQVIQAAATLDPTNPDIVELQHGARTANPSLIMPSKLGVNRYKRISATPSLRKRILFYVPDRVLDLLDVIGFDVHLGPGLYLNYHVTRAVQIGGGARAVAGLGWHTKRSLGLLGNAEAGLNLIAAGAQTVNAGQLGTSGVQTGSYHQAGLHRPTDPVYQEMRDYWAVGADVTFLVFGISWDVHPVEAADFLAGFALRDFLHDDLGSTQRLKLTDDDKDNVQEIITVLRTHRDEVEAYRQAKQASRPTI